MKKNPISGQTKKEEIANVITHAFGIVLGVAALAILVVFVSLKGDFFMFCLIKFFDIIFID